MADLRNPFAIKDGKIVVIDDLSEHEKGLACRCICPSCGGEFIARMGNVNVHHFSHSKNGCDEERAFLVGLYKLYKQYLDDGNDVPLPAVNLYCNLGITECITKDNYDFYVKMQNGPHTNYTFKISSDMMLKPDCSEIVYDSKGKPEALVVTKGIKKLALVIQYPKIGCSMHYVSQYKELSSLKIDLKEMNDGEIKNTSLLYKMFDNISLYTWINNNIGLSLLSEINEINTKKWYQSAEERKRQQQRKEYELRAKKSEKDIQIEKKLLPLKNYMIKFYSDNDLGVPDTDSKSSLYNFTCKFKNSDELGRLEAELCIENGMLPIDHWGQIWLKCRKCGTLVKLVLKENEPLPTNFTTICLKCIDEF